MMSVIKKGLIFLLISHLIVVVANGVQAQGTSLALDPILVQTSVRAGDVITRTISIDNLDKYDQVVLEVSIADIEEDIWGVYSLRPLGSSKHTLAGSVEVSSKRIIVPAGGSAELAVKISLPRGSSGGRYGAVVFTVVPEKTQQDDDPLSTSEFSFQMATFFEIVIGGSSLRTQAFVDSFFVASSGDFPQLRQYVGDNAIVFTTAVANEGNVHLITSGSLLITTSEGRTVARYPLGGGRGVILPNCTVALQTVMPRILSPGEYKARAVISYGGTRPLVSSVEFIIDETAIQSRDSKASGLSLSRFNISPENIEVTLRPGAFQSAIIEITNHGDESIELEGYVLPLEFDLFGNLIPEEERAKPVPWVEINPRSFSVAPGRTKKIRLTLRPPRDLLESVFCDILFKSITDGSIVEAGVNLLAIFGEGLEKLGSLEIVNVNEVDAGLAVDVLFTNEGPLAVTPRLELVVNQIHPQTEGEGGRVIAGRTETIALIDLPVNENPVLPQRQRLFNFMIPLGFEDGRYQIIVRVDYGGEAPAIVRLDLNVGDDA